MSQYDENDWMFMAKVLKSRLELKLLKLKSGYWDGNQDSQIMSIDIETGIETLNITVLIPRLVYLGINQKGFISRELRFSLESLLISGFKKKVIAQVQI